MRPQSSTEEASNKIFKPKPRRIRRMCLRFQRNWTDNQCNERMGNTHQNQNVILQYYTHHRECVRLPENSRMLTVWRGING